jgi:hypothetical protein
LNPANNSVIAQPLGRVNVTVECAVHNGNNTQMLTGWNIAGLGGVEGLLDISRAPSVELGGTPTYGLKIVDSYRDEATFTEFTMDMDGARVFCGQYPNAYGIFHLRVFGKFSWKTMV